ncbi:MAG: glycosyltransferase family 4 protein [Acidocella sp.]|uniref:glycosyltransferase family 4 protein n=1 Tax=Acidocella sp. TaxID=50710 RepID=UPI003FD78FF4
MIAFVTDELPRPGAAGHLALNHAIIDWLRQEGFAVTILLTGSRLAWPVQRYTETRVLGPHITRVGPYLGALSPVTALSITLRALLRRLPPPIAARLRRARHNADAVLGTFPSPSDLRWCARAIERLQPKAVLIDTVFRAPLLAEPELAGVNRLVITHDVFHRRAQALSAAGYHVLPENFSRVREATLLGRAISIAAIQPEEAEELRAMCPARNIFTAPMPALPCPRPPDVERIPGRLIFVGSNSLPNLDGLRWFFSEIWPPLLSEGLTLDLVGDCGPALTRLPRGVKAWGRVPSLAPLLHRASLAISPLRAGSGLKIKLLDYARHGLYTIATPPSLQGFYLDADSPFIMAGSANMFVQAVLRHVASPPQPGAALSYVSLHYGVKASFAGLRAALTPGLAPEAQDNLRSLKL